MKIIPAEHASTDLERNALQWLNEQGEGYDTGAAGAAADLFHGGCISGIVGHLIYTRDCNAFAAAHLADILDALQDYHDETGEWLAPRNGQNLDVSWMAWAGFELAARAVCDRAEIEV